MQVWTEHGCLACILAFWNNVPHLAKAENTWIQLCHSSVIVILTWPTQTYMAELIMRELNPCGAGLYFLSQKIFGKGLLISLPQFFVSNSLLNSVQENHDLQMCWSQQIENQLNQPSSFFTTEKLWKCASITWSQANPDDITWLVKQEVDKPWSDWWTMWTITKCVDWNPKTSLREYTSNETLTTILIETI